MTGGGTGEGNRASGKARLPSCLLPEEPRSPRRTCFWSPPLPSQQYDAICRPSSIALKLNSVVDGRPVQFFFSASDGDGPTATGELFARRYKCTSPRDELATRHGVTEKVRYHTWGERECLGLLRGQYLALRQRVLVHRYLSARYPYGR